MSKDVTVLDYDAIPLLDDRTNPNSRLMVSLTRHESTSPCRYRGFNHVSPGEPLRVGSTHVRFGGTSLAFIGNEIDDPGHAVDPFIGTKALVPLEWTTFDTAKRDAKIASVTYAAGMLDMRWLLATIDRAGTVDALALAPGLVYAFRRCEAHCDGGLGDPERVEVVTMVGPPSLWVGTSANDHQTVAHDSPFGDVSAPIRRGSSATLSMLVSRDELRAFAKTGAETRGSSHGVTLANAWSGSALARPNGPESFSLDVVWPSGERPSATFYRGEIDAPTHRSRCGPCQLSTVMASDGCLLDSRRSRAITASSLPAASVSSRHGPLPGARVSGTNGAT